MFKCNVCGRKFKGKKWLANHLTKAHGAGVTVTQKPARERIQHGHLYKGPRPNATPSSMTSELTARAQRLRNAAAGLNSEAEKLEALASGLRKFIVGTP